MFSVIIILSAGLTIWDRWLLMEWEIIPVWGEYSSNSTTNKRAWDLISYQQLLTAALAGDDEGEFGSSLGAASTFVEKMGSAPGAVYCPFLDWYKSAYDSIVNGIGEIDDTLLIRESKNFSSPS
jgi:hypothetical protein